MSLTACQNRHQRPAEGTKGDEREQKSAGRRKQEEQADAQSPGSFSAASEQEAHFSRARLRESKVKSARCFESKAEKGRGDEPHELYRLKMIVSFEE